MRLGRDPVVRRDQARELPTEPAAAALVGPRRLEEAARLGEPGRGQVGFQLAEVEPALEPATLLVHVLRLA